MNEHKELAEELHCLRQELMAWRGLVQHYLQSNLVTHADLHEAKTEILKALGERVNPASVAALGRASDKLETAIAANQPISGTKPG